VGKYLLPGVILAGVLVALLAEVVFGMFLAKWTWETGKKELSPLAKWPFLALIGLVLILVAISSALLSGDVTRERLLWSLLILWVGCLTAAALTAWYASIVYRARPCLTDLDRLLSR
jgi:hypothetical protein